MLIELEADLPDVAGLLLAQQIAGAPDVKIMGGERKACAEAGIPKLDCVSVLTAAAGASGLSLLSMSWEVTRSPPVSTGFPLPSVASTSAVDRLSRLAHDIIALIVDPAFMAVGQYYEMFPQTSDEEVLVLLHTHA